MENQLNVLIYETAEPVKKKLHDVLVSYAIARNTEIKIDWIRPDTAPEALAKAREIADDADINEFNIGNELESRILEVNA